MKVFLLKDIEKVGMAGEIITIAEGYARNFLIPRKLALEVTPQNQASLLNKIKTVEHRKDVIESKTSMLAEKIKSLELAIKRKTHDQGKLYGSISEGEIVDLLAQKGISVAKNQVAFDKTIKAQGVYKVTIKLSSKLQPVFTLKVIPEQQARA